MVFGPESGTRQFIATAAIVASGGFAIAGCGGEAPKPTLSGEVHRQVGSIIRPTMTKIGSKLVEFSAGYKDPLNRKDNVLVFHTSGDYYSVEAMTDRNGFGYQVIAEMKRIKGKYLPKTTRDVTVQKMTSSNFSNIYDMSYDPWWNASESTVLTKGKKSKVNTYSTDDIFPPMDDYTGKEIGYDQDALSYIRSTAKDTAKKAYSVATIALKGKR